MIGKKFIITGMQLEIVSDSEDKWKARNITTNQIIFIDKSVLEQSIKLGKAEEISGPNEENGSEHDKSSITQNK